MATNPPADDDTFERANSTSSEWRTNPIGRIAVTSFVGRRRELAEAKHAITESRLVTLTGPGGVGKTRIAVELAKQTRKAFGDGAWVVELATVTDGANLASNMLSALAIPDQSVRDTVTKLVDHLRDRHVLLVLDNCEHLLQPTAELVSDLLGECPALHIVATSREPLNIAGERICVVPPMPTPPNDQTHCPDGLYQFESVRLLLDRGQSINADFAVTTANTDAIVDLCNKLDGIPLAIELAVARLRVLSVSQIVERLDRRFQLLTDGDRAAQPRQQTLHALITWSYDLCSSSEKILWARLSVFTGSFDIRAVEDVCGFGDLSPDDMIDVLGRLVAKSLLVTEHHAETVRYRQLMTVREYGQALLEESSDTGLVRGRHRDHYLHKAITMVENWCGPGQATVLAETRRDHPNLITALEWSTATPGEIGPAAALASMLRYHWIAGGYLSDGRRWLERILKSIEKSDSLRGETLWVAAWVALIQGDRKAATAWLTDSQETARLLRDQRLDANVTQWTAENYMFSGNTEEAVRLLEQAIARHVEQGDKAAQLTALFQLAMAQTYSDRHQAALDTCATAIELTDTYGERWARAYTRWISGVTRWHLGDLVTARDDAREALVIQRDFKDGICTSLTIDLLGWIAASDSDFKRAAELSAIANAVWNGLGTSIAAFGPEIHRDSIESARTVETALGRQPVATIIGKYASLRKEEAVDLVLASIQPTEPREHIPAPPKSPLTKRELEIATLIATGLTNRAIAENLFISPRTVDGHVERILAKLNFTARTQIASWVANH
jgi:predicted ATPase/DNA-binding CsgD family transcriptional regulator